MQQRLPSVEISVGEISVEISVVDRIVISWLYVLSFSAAIFLGSSAVEQSAVNRLVGGSNPSRGAIHKFSDFLRSPRIQPKYRKKLRIGSIRLLMNV
jgi:hypothetical protein